MDNNNKQKSKNLLKTMIGILLAQLVFTIGYFLYNLIKEGSLSANVIVFFSVLIVLAIFNGALLVKILKQHKEDFENEEKNTV